MQKSVATLTQDDRTTQELEKPGPQSSGAPTTACVWAVIPAFRRAHLLEKALESLNGQGTFFAGALIVNNSNDADTRRVAAAATVHVEVIEPGGNLGTAGGIGLGMTEALKRTSATHIWIMDDDACATPGALDAMLGAAGKAAADAVVPLVTDASGKVRWCPGPLPRRVAKAVKGGLTPEEFRTRFDGHVYHWSWAIWASLLLSRRAVEETGVPRTDLWSQFSDLEYTLRLSRRFKGVLAVEAVCQHLPPIENESAAMRAKLRSALQNGTFVCTRLRHGWRALRHLPGLHYRFLRHYKWSSQAFADCVQAAYKGGVRGRPSGAPASETRPVGL